MAQPSSSKREPLFPAILEVDEPEGDNPSPPTFVDDKGQKNDIEEEERERDRTVIRHIDAGSDEDSSLWGGVVTSSMPLNTGSRTSSGNFSPGYTTSDKEGGGGANGYGFGEEDDRLNLSYESDLDKIDYDGRSNESLTGISTGWRNKVRNAWSKIVETHKRLHYNTLSPSENHLAHAIRRRGEAAGETSKDEPPPIRDSVKLTIKLLDLIGNSIQQFKPSESLAKLNEEPERERERDREREREREKDRRGRRGLQGKSGRSRRMTSSFADLVSMASDAAAKRNSDSPAPQAEVDIVISGGGMKGFFMCGAAHIITKELERYNVRIARISGASAGAWGAMFMLTGVSTAHWMETYYACREAPGERIHEVCIFLFMHV